MPFCILRFMERGGFLKRAAVAGSIATLGLLAASAEAAPKVGSTELALPRLVIAETASQRAVVSLSLAAGILDLRTVQDDPVMRARRDYSLMTALPVVSTRSAPSVPVLSETQTWKLSRTVLLTFPLAITGRNLVTAEIAGTGQLAVMPTGLAQGGVFTFTGAF